MRKTDKVFSKRGSVSTLQLFFIAIAVFGLVFCANFSHRAALAKDAITKYGIEEIIQELGQELSKSSKKTAQALSRYGFEAEVKEMLMLDGIQQLNISPSMMIEHLYRRIENKKHGEGQRFLALLHRRSSEESAALAIDPAFKNFLRYSDAQLIMPFKFAEPSKDRYLQNAPPLSPFVEKTISVLSEFYSTNGWRQGRTDVLRNFRNKKLTKRKLDKVLLKSKTSNDALREIINIGTPPPKPEKAAINLLRDAMLRSAALDIDADMLSTIRKLSNDLPPALEAYTTAQNRIESRKQQIAEIKRAKIVRMKQNGVFETSTKTKKRQSKEIGEAKKKIETDKMDVADRVLKLSSGKITKLHNPRKTTTGQRVRTSTERGKLDIGTGNPFSSKEELKSYEELSDLEKAFRDVRLSKELENLKKAYNELINRVNTNDSTYNYLERENLIKIHKELENRTKKLDLYLSYEDSVYLRKLHKECGDLIKYRRQGLKIKIPPNIKIKKPKPEPYRPRGRVKGIIIGGNKIDDWPAIPRPKNAFWLPNRQDSRFGRLFVKFAKPRSIYETPGFFTYEISTIIAVSKVMFADSFHSAWSVLWDESGKELPFKDGEELVLMNIDLLSQANMKAVKELLAKKKATEQNDSASEDQTQHLRIFRELISKSNSKDSVPLSITLHPATSKRELAWSAARVDVWLYQMNLLSQEAAALNGGRPIPMNLKNIPISDASIWIFHERDCFIEMDRTTDSRVKLLVINSNRPEETQNKTTGHFEISMFAVPDTAYQNTGQNKDKLLRLHGLEENAQQLTDWLCINHHDFMRLNDFSEAFSLLRWLRSNNAELKVIEIDEQSRPMVTPDHVIIGKGPCVRNQ